MKIICIWQNGILKKAEKSVNSAPVFYYKPETTLLLNNRPFYYPEYSSHLVCNAEAVVRICKAGKYIQKKFAHTYYDEIAIGINITAIDIQKECIKNKHPLSKSFSFDGSSPLSQFTKKEIFENSNDTEFQMMLNDEAVQKFRLSELRFSFEEIITNISQYMMLKTGDIIFSGPVIKPLNIEIGQG